MIRAFDIIVSVAGLVILSPLMLLIAFLIKIDSRGPVLFRQTRVGQGGRRFALLKFRKMYDDLRAQGPAVTSRYDRRLTIAGRWLERTKLDELPQLINVLKGDMSVVGPRPEIEKFTRCYPEQWEKVLAARPGLIGPSQIAHRNESEMYPADCLDREDYYVKHILPEKLRLDIEYLEKASFGHNLRLLALALLRTVFGMVTQDSLVSTLRGLYLLAVYTLCSVLSMALAYRLRFTDAVPVRDAQAYHASLVLVPLVYPLVFLLFRAHRRLFGAVTLEDVVALFNSCAIGSFLIIAALLLFDIRNLSRLVYGFDFFIRFMLLVLIAFLEWEVLQKNKLLASRAIRKEVAIEAAAAGVISLGGFLLAYRLTSPGGAFLQSIAETRGVLFFLLFLNPFIYLATFREVPRGLLYYLKMKLKQMFMIVALGSMMLVIVSMFLDVRVYTGEVILLSLLLSFAGLTVFLLLTWAVIWRKLPEIKRERVLLIGLTPEMDLFIDALRRSHANYSIMGILSNDTKDRFYTVSKIEILGALNDLRDVLSVYHVDTFVVAREAVDGEYLRWVRKIAHEFGVRIRMVSGVDGFMRNGSGRRSHPAFGRDEGRPHERLAGQARESASGLALRTAQDEEVDGAP